MRIGLYFISITRASYLIAKTLALGGCEVWVRFEIPEADMLAGRDGAEAVEREYCSWLYFDEQIHIALDVSAAPPFDALLYEMGPKAPRFPKDLQAWIRKAGRVAAWNVSHQEYNFLTNLRAELGTVMNFLRFLPYTRSIVMSNGSLFGRPTAPFQRVLRQGYFVHPRFLRESALREEMFAGNWLPDRTRPVSLMFSGNPQPESRMQLVEDLRRFIAESSKARIVDHYKDLVLSSSCGETQVLWMSRTDPHDRQWHLRDDVVPPAKWPQIMRLCDFAFCPPGYERKTHRVIESLLQGTIPILDCPNEYDIGLRDGENCIVARKGRWTDALRRALEMSDGDVRTMRLAVFDVARERLHHTGAAKNWLRRLGTV